MSTDIFRESPGTSSALPIVGRKRERRELRSIVDRVLKAKTARLALIAGEAGVGKSALVTELIEFANERGASTALGYCIDHSTSPPFLPWLEVLSQSRGFPDGRQARGVPIDEALRGDPPTKSALFLEVEDVIKRVTSEKALVLVLEDLHWADAGSLELFWFIVHRLRLSGLMLIGTYRGDEIQDNSPLKELLPLLARQSLTSHFRLRSLTLDDTRVLLKHQFDLPLGEQSRLLKYVHRLANGNPLYIRELIQDLIEDETLREAGSGWHLGDLGNREVPTLIRQVIESRIARLSKPSQELLQVLAVVGHHVPVERMRALISLDEREIDKALREATFTQIIKEIPEPPALEFTHALLREALYHGLPINRRTTLHQQVGEYLLNASPSDPDEIAHHLLRSGDARALDWLTIAGDRAQNAYAWSTAADRFESALALLEGRHDSGTQMGWLCFRLGWMYRWIDVERSIANFQRAFQLTNQVGDELLAAYAMFDEGQVKQNLLLFDEGVRQMREGLEMIGRLSDKEVERLRQLEDAGVFPDLYDRRGTLTNTLAGEGRLAEARTLGESVIAPDLTLPFEHTNFRHADAYLGLHHVYTSIGEFDLAEMAAQRGWHAYGANPLASELLGHHLVMGIMRYSPDDLLERERLAVQAERELQTASAMNPLWNGRWVWRTILFVEGDWGEAFELAAERTRMTFDGASLMARIAYHRGDTDTAWSLVLGGLPEGSRTQPGGNWLPVAIELLQVATEMSIDAAELAQAESWLALYDRWLRWSGAVAGLAEAQLLRARLNHARGDHEVSARNAISACNHASEPRQPLILIAVHRFLGELAASQSKFEVASSHLTESLTLAESCNAVYERALTLSAFAELHQSHDKLELAIEQASEARNIFIQIGARPDEERANRILCSADSKRIYANEVSILTRRELEVLRLVARGLSNRQISDELYISPRTVMNHVARILDKLDLESRTAAAAYAIHNGLAS